MLNLTNAYWQLNSKKGDRGQVRLCSPCGPETTFRRTLGRRERAMSTTHEFAATLQPGYNPSDTYMLLS